MLSRSSPPHLAAWKDYMRPCASRMLLHIYRHDAQQRYRELRFSADMLRVMLDGIEATMNRTHPCKPRWFQFVSDSCVPTRSCNRYLDYLTSVPAVSFIEVPKSPQWVTLHADQLRLDDLRKHVQQVTCRCPCGRRRCHYNTRYKRDSRRGAPDEFVFGDFWTEHNMPTQNRTLTYVEWPRRSRGHPRRFARLTTRVRSAATSQNKFFARKVVPQQEPASRSKTDGDGWWWWSPPREKL